MRKGITTTTTTTNNSNNNDNNANANANTNTNNTTNNTFSEKTIVVCLREKQGVLIVNVFQTCFNNPYVF